MIEKSTLFSGKEIKKAEEISVHDFITMANKICNYFYFISCHFVDQPYVPAPNDYDKITILYNTHSESWCEVQN